MRNALSIAAGASSETRKPIAELSTQAHVDQAEPEAHRQHEDQHAADVRVVASRSETRSGKPIPRSGGRHIASWTAVPATTPIAYA